MNLSRDLNAARHRLRLFGDGDRQYPVFTGCINLFTIYRLRQHEATTEMPKTSLRALELRPVTFFYLF